MSNDSSDPKKISETEFLRQNDVTKESQSTLIRIAVDFASEQGKFKLIHGVNNGPLLYYFFAFAGGTGNNMLNNFNSLQVPLVRLHDDSLINPGCRLVDIPHVFGNEEAESGDPRNYYFDQTDDYIRAIVENGSEVMYRLGPSIEHTQRGYFVRPPKDYEKWVDICLHIIRHYNCGWKNGFNWNIRYWEIWNEPNHLNIMWKGGDYTDYCRLYVMAAKKIKAEFPDLKVGGPSDAHSRSKTEEFLTYCRKEDAPLDFYSFHMYGNDPQDFTRSINKEKELLQKYGYGNAELHLNEWHYSPCGGIYLLDPKYFKACQEEDWGFLGSDSSAFTAAILTVFQNTPLDMGGFYRSFGEVWGLISRDLHPSAQFHVFRNYNRLVRNFPERVKAESDHCGVYCLAGRNGQGSGMMMLVDYKTNTEMFEIEFSREVDWSKMNIRLIGGGEEQRLEPYMIEGNTVKILKQKGSGVVFIDGIGFKQ